MPEIDPALGQLFKVSQVPNPDMGTGMPSFADPALNIMSKPKMAAAPPAASAPPQAGLPQSQFSDPALNVMFKPPEKTLEEQFMPNQPPPAKPQAPPEPGIVSTFLQGLYSGFRRRLPEMVGQSMQFAGPGETIPEAGKAVTEWARKGEERPEFKSPLKDWLFQGAEMLAPSVAVPAVLAAGGAGVVPAGIAAGALFGLSQAQQTKETAEKAKVEPGMAPYATGGIEALGETAGTIALQRLFGPLAPVVSKGGKIAIKDIIRPGFSRMMREFFGVTIPVEVGTEMGQQAGEAAVEKASGIRPDADLLKEALSVVGPTAVLSAMTLGMAHPLNRIMSKRFESALSDPNTPEDVRGQTVDTIAKVLGEADPKLGAMWKIRATEAVLNKEVIPLDQDVSEWLQPKIEKLAPEGEATPGEAAPPVTPPPQVTPTPETSTPPAQAPIPTTPKATTPSEAAPQTGPGPEVPVGAKEPTGTEVAPKPPAPTPPKAAKPPMVIPGKEAAPAAPANTEESFSPYQGGQISISKLSENDQPDKVLYAFGIQEGNRQVGQVNIDFDKDTKNAHIAWLGGNGLGVKGLTKAKDLIKEILPETKSVTGTLIRSRGPLEPKNINIKLPQSAELAPTKPEAPGQANSPVPVQGEGEKPITPAPAKAAEPAPQGKAPVVSEYATRGNIKALIVDGETVRRDYGKEGEEFTDFGTHADFPFIPQGQVWIDQSKTPEEYHFFLDNALYTQKMLDEGKSPEDARKLGDRKEADERASSEGIKLAGEVTPEEQKSVELQDLGRTEDGKRIALVDGDKVRSLFKTDFTEGGHDLVYPFIPKDTIWIDNANKASERPQLTYHEALERQEMAKGMGYDPAHARASEREHEFRMNPQGFKPEAGTQITAPAVASQAVAPQKEPLVQGKEGEKLTQPGAVAAAAPAPGPVRPEIQFAGQPTAETGEKIQTPKTTINEPNTLLGWVRSKGGIWDESTGTESFRQKESGIPMLLSKENGRTFDELAKQAIDEGWLAKDSTSNDLMELLKNDISAQENKTPRVAKTTQEYSEENISELEKYFEEKAGIPPALNAREIKTLGLTEENARQLDRLRFDSPETYEKVLRSFAEETKRQHEVKRTGKKYQGEQFDMFGKKIQEELGAMKEAPAQEPRAGDFVTFTDENGKTQNGKVRDYDTPGKMALVFPEDQSLIKNKDMASIEVPMDKIQKVTPRGEAPAEDMAAKGLPEEHQKVLLRPGESYPAHEAIRHINNSPDIPAEDKMLGKELLRKYSPELHNIPIKTLRPDMISRKPGSAAYYNQATGDVWLDPSLMQNKTPEQASRTIFHEVIHGIIANKMTVADRAELMEMMRRAESVMSEKEKKIWEDPQTDRTGRSKTYAEQGLTEHSPQFYYALSGPHEMLSQLAHPEVRDMLKTIDGIEKVEKGQVQKNLWQRFLEWMNHIIYGPKSNPSLLSNFYDKLGEIGERPSFQDIMDKARQRDAQNVAGLKTLLPETRSILPELAANNLENTDQYMAHRAAADPGFIKWVKNKMGFGFIDNKDLNILEQQLSLPWHLAKKYPQLKVMVEDQLKREQNRSAGVVQFKEATNSFLNLSGPELDKVEKALSQGDKENFIYTNDQLINQFHLTDAGREAYHSVRATLEQLFKRKLDHAERMLLRPYERTLTDAEFATLQENYKKELTDEEKAALDPNIAKIIDKLQKPMNLIRQIRQDIQRYKGYFPREREKGNFYISVWVTENDAEGNPREVPAYFGFKNTQRETMDMVKDLKAQYPDAKVNYGRWTQEQESAFFGMSDMNLMRFIDKSIDKLKAGEQIPEATHEGLRNALAQSVGEMLLARGAGAHQIHRNPRLIEGYKTTGLKEVLMNYITGYMGAETKQEAAFDFMDSLQAVPKDQPKLFEEMSHYASSMLRNFESMDRSMSKARAFAAIWYLGGSVRSAALNFTQNFVQGIPFLARIMKPLGKGPLAAERSYIKAMWDVAMGHGTDDEKMILHEMVNSGINNDQQIRQISRETRGGTPGIIGNVMDIMMAPFSLIEKFNRNSAALAAYRVYQELGLGGEELATKTRDYVYDVHNLMTRANLPHAMRGGDLASQLLGTAYTFRRFNHNYILAMIYSMRGADGKISLKNSDVLIRSLAWFAIIGGAPALPFLDDILDELEKFFGRPFRTEMRNTLRQVGGEPLEQLGVAGIPAMLGQVLPTGVDMSGSLKIGLPSISDPLKGATETVTGVWGGLAQKATGAYKQISLDQYTRAFENASPIFIENIMKAVRMASQGATTPTGKPLYDVSGKPIVETAPEAAAQTLGFRPERISRMAGTHRTFANVEQHYDAERKEIEARFRLAKTPEERQGVIKDVQKYNMEVSQYRGVIPPINSQMLRRSVQAKPEKKYLRFGNQMISNQ